MGLELGFPGFTCWFRVVSGSAKVLLVMLGGLIATSCNNAAKAKERVQRKPQAHTNSKQRKESLLTNNIGQQGYCQRQTHPSASEVGGMSRRL